jgi:hypothetical protein
VGNWPGCAGSTSTLVCATDGDRLHPGLGALLESFIGRLAAQAAVGAVVVVEVLPLPQLVVEDSVSSITTPSSSW